VFDLPPIRFMAMASVVCASRLIEPKLIAPVANRFTISAAGSTSSTGTGVSAHFRFIRPRIVSRRSLCSLIVRAKALYSSELLPRTACCSRATLSGVQA
jgi:hypothetical protein